MNAYCVLCGASFDSETRTDRQTIEGHRLVQEWAVKSECPACVALGQAPPLSPCCGAKMHGSAENFEVGFTCGVCDIELDLDTIRIFALGLAVERIVTEHPPGTIEPGRTLDLVYRAAHDFGTRPRPV